MEQKKEKDVWTCKHCPQTFTTYVEWLTHNCEPQPVQNNLSATLLSNAPRCQVESDGDCVWA